MDQPSTTGSSSSFRFLDLPLELQRQVLIQYFGSWTITIAYKDPPPPDAWVWPSEAWWGREHFLDGVPSLAVLSVNKHIHHESKPLLWAAFTGIVSYEHIEMADMVEQDKSLMDNVRTVESRITALKTNLRGPIPFEPKWPNGGSFLDPDAKTIGLNLNLKTIDCGVVTYRQPALGLHTTFTDFLAGNPGAEVAVDVIVGLKHKHYLFEDSKMIRPRRSPTSVVRKGILYKAVICLDIEEEWGHDEEVTSRKVTSRKDKLPAMYIVMEVEVTLEPASILVKRIRMCNSMDGELIPIWRVYLETDEERSKRLQLPSRGEVVALSTLSIEELRRRSGQVDDEESSDDEDSSDDEEGSDYEEDSDGEAGMIDLITYPSLPHGIYIDLEGNILNWELPRRIEAPGFHIEETH